MSESKVANKTIKSFIFYALTTLINITLSYILLVIFANYMSKNNYAEFGFYNTIFALALIGFNFGHKEILFKASSIDDKQLLVSSTKSYLMWQLLLLGCCGILFLSSPVLAVIALNFIVINWLYAATSINRGRGQYSKDAIALPLQRLVWLGGCIWAFSYYPNVSLMQVFMFSLIAAAITLILLFPKVNDLYIPKSLHSVCQFWQDSVKNCNLLLKYCVIEFTTVAYLKLDMLFLQWFKVTPSLMADYYLSIQIFEATILMITPIGYFFFNRYAQQTNGNKASLNFVVNMVLRFSAVMFGIIFLGHILWLLVGRNLLVLMFSDYLGSFELVTWNLFALYPLAVNIILSNYLIINHQERGYMKVCFFALLVNIIANTLLISFWSVQGAVVTRILTELFLCLSLVGFIYFMPKKRVNYASV